MMSGPVTVTQCHFVRLTFFYKYSFFPLAIVQWNAFSESVVSLQDLESFKVALSKLQTLLLAFFFSTNIVGQRATA